MADRRKPFYVVWNQAHGLPKVPHGTYSLAYEEAKRLARKCPGHQFHVLGVIATAVVSEPLQVVEYEQLPIADSDFDEVPF